MHTKNQHIKRANLNEEFASAISSADKKFRYWIVTAYHYSAIHWIDAYLAKNSINARTHRNRDNCIARDSMLRHKIHGDYCDLKYLCRNARYELFPIGKKEIQEAQKYLKTIKEHIQKII